MKRSTANRIIALKSFYHQWWTRNPRLKFMLGLSAAVITFVGLFGGIGAYCGTAGNGCETGGIQDPGYHLIKWILVSVASVDGFVLTIIYGLELYFYIDKKVARAIEVADGIHRGVRKADDDEKPTAGALSNPPGESGSVTIVKVITK